MRKHWIILLLMLGVLMVSAANDNSYNWVRGRNISLEVVGSLNSDNLTYGEMYLHNHGGVTITISDTTSYYNITGMSAGSLQNITFNGNKLNITENGTYKIDFSLAFGGAANEEYYIDLLKNNEDIDECETHRKLGAGGDVGSAGFTCIEYLEIGDELTIGFKDTGAPAVDINVYVANLNLIKLTKFKEEIQLQDLIINGKLFTNGTNVQIDRINDTHSWINASGAGIGPGGISADLRTYQNFTLQNGSGWFIEAINITHSRGNLSLRSNSNNLLITCEEGITGCKFTVLEPDLNSYFNKTLVAGDYIIFIDNGTHLNISSWWKNITASDIIDENFLNDSGDYGALNQSLYLETQHNISMLELHKNQSNYSRNPLINISYNIVGMNELESQRPHNPSILHSITNTSFYSFIGNLPVLTEKGIIYHKESFGQTGGLTANYFILNHSGMYFDFNNMYLQSVIAQDFTDQRKGLYVNWYPYGYRNQTNSMIISEVDSQKKFQVTAYGDVDTEGSLEVNREAVLEESLNVRLTDNTVNSDYVWWSGRDKVGVSVTEDIEPLAGQWTEYLITEHDSRMRMSEGTIENVSLWMGFVTAIPDITTRHYITVWRNSSDGWDLIGSSEDITAFLATDTRNNITVNVSIPGVKEGDYIGIRRYHTTDTAFNDWALENKTANAGGYRWHNSLLSNRSADWDNSDGFDTSNYIPIRTYGQAPEVVFIGDSLTSGTQVAGLGHASYTDWRQQDALTSSYPYYVGQALNSTYQNMGIGSDRLTGTNIADSSYESILNRWDTDVLNLKPKIAVLMIGTNDIALGNTSEHYKNTMREVLLLQRANNIQTIILSVPPAKNSSTSQAKLADEYNNATLYLINEEFSQDNIKFVDTAKYLGVRRNSSGTTDIPKDNVWDVPPFFNADGYHFTKEGYKRMAEAALEAFGYTRIQGTLDTANIIVREGIQFHPTNTEQYITAGRSTDERIRPDFLLRAGQAAYNKTNGDGGVLVLDAGLGTGSGGSLVVVRSGNRFTDFLNNNTDQKDYYIRAIFSEWGLTIGDVQARPHRLFIKDAGNTSIKIAQTGTSSTTSIARLTNPSTGSTGSFFIDDMDVSGVSFIARDTESSHLVCGEGTCAIYTKAGLTPGSSFTSNRRLWINHTGAMTYNDIYTFPLVDGSSGQCMSTDGSGTLSWAACSGGPGGSPGGSDPQIQYNDGGAFGGDAQFTWDEDENRLNITNNARTAIYVGAAAEDRGAFIGYSGTTNAAFLGNDIDMTTGTTLISKASNISSIAFHDGWTELYNDAETTVNAQILLNYSVRLDPNNKGVVHGTVPETHHYWTSEGLWEESDIKYTGTGSGWLTKTLSNKRYNGSHCYNATVTAKTPAIPSGFDVQFNLYIDDIFDGIGVAIALQSGGGFPGFPMNYVYTDGQYSIGSTDDADDYTVGDTARWCTNLAHPYAARNESQHVIWQVLTNGLVSVGTNQTRWHMTFNGMDNQFIGTGKIEDDATGKSFNVVGGGANGTNREGGSLGLWSGLGTGDEGGDIKCWNSAPGSSGTQENSHQQTCLIDENGTVTFNKQLRARAYRSGTQAIATAATTQIQMNAEVYDQGGKFSTSTYRYTPNVDGYYSVTCHITASAISAGTTASAYIYKNGAVLTRTLEYIGSTGSQTIMSHDIVYLDSNDYVDCRFAGDASYNIAGFSSQTYLAVHKLS